MNLTNLEKKELAKYKKDNRTASNMAGGSKKKSRKKKEKSAFINVNINTVKVKKQRKKKIKMPAKSLKILPRTKPEKSWLYKYLVK